MPPERPPAPRSSRVYRCPWPSKAWSVRLRSPVTSGVEIHVAEEDAGARLDVLLVRRIPGLSRRRASDLAASGKVKVNGRRARKGATVAAGDTVTLDEVPEAG